MLPTTGFTALTLTLTLTLAALLLSGCVPSAPPATSTPSPAATPVFASEEDALVAAEAAYAEYLRVSDAITADGGTEPERIEPLVTAEQYEVELEGFLIYSSRGWKTTGASSFSDVVLQSYRDQGGIANISLYVCSDISALKIFDSAGSDLTPSEVPERQTLQLFFTTQETSDLLLESAEIWNSESGC